MNKDDFFKKIKEAEQHYYKNSPCHHCYSGNGCDDCRDCKDGEIDYQMYQEVKKLKDEYKEKFGVDYDEEIKELTLKTSKEIHKKKLLEKVWEKCNLQEILNAGYECEAIQAIDIIKEAEQIEKESFSVSLKTDFIENLRELFDKTPSRELPWARDVMEEISVHYSDSSMMDFFDKDDLIEHCDDSWEMDAFLEKKLVDKINEYIEDNPPQGKKEIIQEVQNNMPYQFRRFLCDLIDANYYITDDELFNELKKRI